jgi:hypothetical protein
MESPPDPVPIEILDDAKPVAACPPLDRPSEVTESSAWLSGDHGVALSMLGGLEQPGGHRGDLAHGNAYTCVREVTVQLGRHVKVYEVAIAQLALHRRNAMGRFIIDADTRGAWKSVGDTGCRASSVASEYLSAHGVEFAGGRARSDGLHHGPAGFGDNTTSTKECIEIFLLVNRHLGILRRGASCTALEVVTHPVMAQWAAGSATRIGFRSQSSDRSTYECSGKRVTLRKLHAQRGLESS